MRFGYLPLIAIFSWIAFAAETAHADPNKALEAFLSACLRSDVSLKVSRPEFERLGVRSASMNEGLFDLEDETVKGTVYQVDPGFINYNRPYITGCNVVARDRFSKSLKAVLEKQLASRGFAKIKERPKFDRIEIATDAINSSYEKDGRTFDIYVGDLSAVGIGKRTFLILGLRP